MIAWNVLQLHPWKIVTGLFLLVLFGSSVFSSAPPNTCELASVLPMPVNLNAKYNAPFLCKQTSAKRNCCQYTQEEKLTNHHTPAKKMSQG